MMLLNKNPLSQKNLNGIEGLLLFLCISLTIITPLINIILLVPFIHNLIVNFELLKTIPNIILYFLILLLFTCFVLILSMISGILLWKKHYKAVFLVKLSLLTNVLTAIFIFILPYCLSLPEHFINQIYASSFRSLLQPIVYSTIWFTYLLSSERVANTFPKARE